MANQIFSGIIWASQLYSEIDARVVILEDNVHKYEVFEVINSGITGTISISEHSALLLNQYPNAEDCLILKIDPLSGRPLEEYVYDGNSQIVTATLDLNGNWEITNESAFDYPIALVYQIQLAEKYKNELDNSIILQETDIESAEATTYDDSVTLLGTNNVQDTIDTIQTNNPGIQFDITQAVLPAEGEVSWNDTEQTLVMGMAGGNVFNSLGQEILLPRRVRNVSGVDIKNGDLIYISGGSGVNAYVTLAQANSELLSANTIAMATEDIDTNALGWGTTFGLVKGDTVQPIDTSAWASGTVLYLSPTIAGKFTNIRPTAPDHTVIVGHVFRSHTTEGSILVAIQNGWELDELHDVRIDGLTDKDTLEYNEIEGVWENIPNFNLVAKDTTGIPEEQKANFTIDYNYTTRVVTLTRINDWFYYYKGERVDITATLTIPAHANAYGIYFFYFSDASGTIGNGTVPWNIKESAPIALVLFNPSATSLIKGWALDERHGLRDTGWHYNQHFAEGAKYISGFDLSGFTLDNDTVAGTTWAVSSGIIADEDLVTTTTALPDNGPYTILFQTASGQWDWITGSATPYFISNGNITYNPIGSGLVEVTTTNRWMNLWVVATPAVNPTFQNIVMVGKYLHNSLDIARASNFNISFPRTSFIPEYVPVAQMNMKYSAGFSTVSGKTQIDDYQYIRGNVSIAGGTPASTLPASAITVDATGFTNNLSTADTTVQLSLQTINSLPKLAGGTYTPSFFAGANITITGVGTAVYSRVGNIVTVSGSVDITLTTSGVYSVMEMTLPIPIVSAGAFILHGNGDSGVPSTSGWKIASGGTTPPGRAILNLTPTSNGVVGLTYTFQYEIR